MSETPDEIIERQGQMIVKQAEEIQRMEGYVAELLLIAANHEDITMYPYTHEKDINRIDEIEEAMKS